MKLRQFMLFGQSTQTREGLQRAVALVPLKSQICFLGSVPPVEDICVFALCPDRATSPEGVEKPYEPHELAHLEFILVHAEQPVPDHCVFRAAVRTPVGLLFLFEHRPTVPSLILPAGRPS